MIIICKQGGCCAAFERRSSRHSYCDSCILVRRKTQKRGARERETLRLICDPKLMTQKNFRRNFLKRQRRVLARSFQPLSIQCEINGCENVFVPRITGRKRRYCVSCAAAVQKLSAFIRIVLDIEYSESVRAGSNLNARKRRLDPSIRAKEIVSCAIQRAKRRLSSTWNIHLNHKRRVDKLTQLFQTDVKRIIEHGKLLGIA